jgi:hypothetical protein
MIALLCLGVSADQFFQPMMRGATRISPVMSPVGTPELVSTYDTFAYKSATAGYTAVEEESFGWAGVGGVVLFGLAAVAGLVRPKAPSPSFKNLALLAVEGKEAESRRTVLKAATAGAFAMLAAPGFVLADDAPAAAPEAAAAAAPEAAPAAAPKEEKPAGAKGERPVQAVRANKNDTFLKPPPVSQTQPKELKGLKENYFKPKFCGSTTTCVSTTKPKKGQEPWKDRDSMLKGMPQRKPGRGAPQGMNTGGIGGSSRAKNVETPLTKEQAEALVKNVPSGIDQLRAKSLRDLRGF